MKMNNIIKIHGTMPQIIATLKTFDQIIGQGATLSDVVTLAKYSKIRKIVKNKLKDGKII